MNRPNEEIVLEDERGRLNADRIAAKITSEIDRLDIRQIIADSISNTLARMRRRLRNEDNGKAN